MLPNWTSNFLLQCKALYRIIKTLLKFSADSDAQPVIMCFLVQISTRTLRSLSISSVDDLYTRLCLLLIKFPTLPQTLCIFWSTLTLLIKGTDWSLQCLLRKEHQSEKGKILWITSYCENRLTRVQKLFHTKQTVHIINWVLQTI